MVNIIVKDFNWIEALNKIIFVNMKESSINDISYRIKSDFRYNKALEGILIDGEGITTGIGFGMNNNYMYELKVCERKK